jgi:hypothetical protein
MASQKLDVLSDRFNSLAVAPNAWLLYLPSTSGLAKGDILTVREVDSFGVYLGRYRTGVCALTSTEQFIVYAKGTQCYYFNKLSMPIQTYTSLLFLNNVTTSYTGSLVRTILWSVKVPAGTFLPNDVLRIYAKVFDNATVNNKQFRLCVNTSNAIAGAVEVAILTEATTLLGGSTFIRNIVFKNSVASQQVVPVATSLASDESVSSAAALATIAINFAVDQWFIFTATLAVNTDSIGFNNIYAEIKR